MAEYFLRLRGTYRGANRTSPHSVPDIVTTARRQAQRGSQEVLNLPILANFFMNSTKVAVKQEEYGFTNDLDENELLAATGMVECSTLILMNNADPRDACLYHAPFGKLGTTDAEGHSVMTDILKKFGYSDQQIQNRSAMNNVLTVMGYDYARERTHGVNYKNSLNRLHTEYGCPSQNQVLFRCPMASLAINEERMVGFGQG